jgi:hypothetical protein
MPAFEVRRPQALVSVTVEAASEDEARWFAQVAWVEEAKLAANRAEVIRQPQRPDDDGDARSEARYEQTAMDDASEQTERERWGLGGAESPREGTEA